MRGALALPLVLLALAGCGDEPAPEPAAAPGTTGAPEPEPEPATTAEPESEPEPEPEPEAAPGLPDFLAGYASWSRLNDEPIPPRESDPHRSTKQVYASAAAVDGVFPDGAVVVKEGVRPGTDFVGLVATMRKEAGANPDHNDWVFVEWARDAADEPFTVLAEGAVCSSCHLQARATDYVFTGG